MKTTTFSFDSVHPGDKYHVELTEKFNSFVCWECGAIWNLNEICCDHHDYEHDLHTLA